MPRCYFLSVCLGSSVDQQTHNATLFNLVEQVNLPAGTKQLPTGFMPLEIHAYFHVQPDESGVSVDMRFALQSDTGFETYSDVVSHRLVAPRIRTRTMGVPFPQLLGQYQVCVDYRPSGTTRWQRDPMGWPLVLAEQEQRPAVTH